MLTVFRNKRRAAPVPPCAPAESPAPDAESEQAAFDRAWADYAEWSGMDQDKLPGRAPETPETSEPSVTSVTPVTPRQEWVSAPLPYSAA